MSVEEVVRRWHVAEAEVERLQGINHELVETHNTYLGLLARAETRAHNAEAQIAAVRALQQEWYTRSCEATSEPLSWRRVSRDLHAALSSPEPVTAGPADQQRGPLPPCEHGVPRHYACRDCIAAPEMCPNCVTPWKCNGPHEPAGEGEEPEAPTADADGVGAITPPAEHVMEERYANAYEAAADELYGPPAEQRCEECSCGGVGSGCRCEREASR